MKPENRKMYLDKSKTDWKLHENGKKVLNWWEDIITNGTGTIKDEIQKEIDDGIDEYLEFDRENLDQTKDDEKDYNNLIQEGINGL